MSVLRYCREPPSAPPTFVCSPFATRPLRLLSRFAPLWAKQHKAVPPIAREVAQKWKAEFLRTLPTDIKELENATKEQSSTDLWYLEFVCRLTASNIKKVVTWQREDSTLIETMLYKEPPTHLPALHWGRVKEPEAVAMYEKMYPERIVTACGISVHQDIKFLAASPDRYVHDSQMQESEEDGLMEVKCPVATMELPEVAAVTKKGFCLKHGDDGTIHLDRNHAYYYQVMCQLSCIR